MAEIRNPADVELMRQWLPINLQTLMLQKQGEMLGVLAGGKVDGKHVRNVDLRYVDLIPVAIAMTQLMIHQYHDWNRDLNYANESSEYPSKP